MRIIKNCRLHIPKEYRSKTLTEENYKTIIEPYERGCKSVENRLRQLSRKYKNKNGRSPIHSIAFRMKSFESVIEKLRKKNLKATCMNTVNRIGDLAGVRIICFYIQEVYQLAEDIKQLKNVILLKERDYIRSPKGNGYRSYHMVIGTKIPTEEEDTYLPVEVQIRTIGMDWWASMEHLLCYKPMEGKDEHYRKEEVKLYSKKLYELEKQMQKFYTPLLLKEEEKERSL